MILRGSAKQGSLVSREETGNVIEEVRAFLLSKGRYIERTFAAKPDLRHYRFVGRDEKTGEFGPVVNVTAFHIDGKWTEPRVSITGEFTDLDGFDVVREVLDLAERAASELAQGVTELNHYAE